MNVSGLYLDDKADKLDDKADKVVAEADKLDDQADKLVAEAKETEHRADNRSTEALVSVFVAVALVCRCYVEPGTTDWTAIIATAHILLPPC